ncbi:MAG: hypothetical protein R8K50_06880 [Mariprofundus sp.]
MKLPAVLLTGLLQTSIKPGMAAAALPWPNGTILSARLENITATTATLVIAGQRMQASLPPGLLANLPANAQLWLELLSRDTPAGMRILTRQQAIHTIAARLAELTGNKPADLPPALQQRLQQPTWPWQDGHPLHAHASEAGNRLLLDDRQNQQPRGMMERSSDEDGFALHGRIDLESVGTLYFALQQQLDKPAKLTLRAADHSNFMQLQQPFAEWVEQQHASDHSMPATLQAQLQEGDEPVLKPRLSRPRQI